MNMKRILASMTLALLGTACASARVGEFHVSAIDSNERDITCVVLMDNEPLLNERNEPIKTPAWVKVPFNKRDGRFEAAKIGVRAVKVGADGKIISGLAEGDVSPYREDWRMLDPEDPKHQLYILRKNKVSSDN